MPPATVSSTAMRMPTTNPGPVRSRIAPSTRTGEAQPVLQRSAVVVGAPVRQRRPELVDEVPVGLDLDAVHPAGLHPLGGVGVLADDAIDVPVLGLLGVRPVGRLAQRRRRDAPAASRRGPIRSAVRGGSVGSCTRHRARGPRRSSAGSTARWRRRRRAGCRTPAGCPRRRPPTPPSSSCRCRPWPSRRGTAGTDPSACRPRSRPVRATTRTRDCAASGAGA